MVRLSRGYGALLTPFVDSRATSARSTPGTWPAPPPGHRGKAHGHLRRALPGHRRRHRGLRGQLRQHHEGAGAASTTFPNILVSANSGIAVGMASQFCGFNLKEVCDTAVAYLKNPDCDLTETLLAPDFPPAAS